METIKHHLAHNLPLDIFSLAVANSTEIKLNWEMAENKALENAFHWLSAPEGFAFWKAINDKYFLMMDDRIIPTPENVTEENERFALFKSILEDVLMKENEWTKEETKKMIEANPTSVMLYYEAANKYAHESSKFNKPCC